ncbi:hypothetical protein H6A07_02915 [Olsenella uli]|uniref:InlB B-repeat-containing protein n=1 Tax=Olsenella uli TaxID=133926 RepID=UPI00195E8535|nr:hypothetical protein [Olsenella uli]MBM6675697.1 hypothetical protein [Olsenella uli]
MGKKLATIAACAFAAVLFAVPAPAWAVEHKGINVNGVDIVTDDDHIVKCGDGTAEYDPTTGVLTLTNAKITKGTGYITTQCGIESGRDMSLNIVLVGENTTTLPISATSGDSADPVIDGTCGDITISGPGSLEVTSSQVAPNAINAYNSLTIKDGARVTVRTESSCAINAQNGSVNIINGAHVEATSAGDYSFAVSALQPSGDTKDNDIVVSGKGTYLKASSAKAAVNAGYPTLCAGNDLVLEDGAVIEVDGTAVANKDVTIQSGAKLSVSNEGGSYALYAVGALTIDGASVSASSVRGYGIVARENLSVHDAVIDAQSTDSNGLRVTGGGATIDGGTITLSSENYAALSTAGNASIVGGVVTLKGGSSGALAVADLNFGGMNWYQWATSAAGEVTKSESDAYDSADRTDTYLRIEPVGTTYDLAVSGGEGSGSYVAGTQVTISADAFNASGHFSGWTVSDPTGAGVLASPSAAETTFTMPAGAVELTANYESHAVLEHVAAVDPSCTSEGTAEHWKCSECGALFSDDGGTTLVSADDLSVPALGHDYVDGVCTVCGEKDPDYVAPEDPEKSDTTIPATGDASVLFSLVPALLGGSALAAGVVARRRR